jgi:hypothetical protein
MTSRERVETALKHGTPDRVPIFEYVLLAPLSDTFLGRPHAGDPAHWPDAVQEMGFEAAVRQNAADRLDLAGILGHDMLFVPPAVPPSERTKGADSSELPSDPVERLLRRNAAAESAAPPPDGYFLLYECLKEEMAQRGIDLPIMAPAYAHGVWTDTDLMQSMLLAPKVAHRHFELATDRGLTLLKGYVASGTDQIGVGGDFSGTRPLISPHAYREFIVPEVRRLSRAVHQAGLWAVNASDGDLWPVIDDFLFGCEVDAFMEIDMHAGMDLGRLSRLYGDRMTFYGNLDCGNTLSFGSEEEVRDHTIACLEAGGGRSHILCASNAIVESVSLGNYLAVVNAHRDFCGLKRLTI